MHERRADGSRGVAETPDGSQGNDAVQHDEVVDAWPNSPAKDDTLNDLAALDALNDEDDEVGCDESKTGPGAGHTRRVGPVCSCLRMFAHFALRLHAANPPRCRFVERTPAAAAAAGAGLE